MRVALPVLGAALLAALSPVPASAQVRDRIIDVYGSEQCPASNGQEIVVCRRHAEGDRFRIPSELRESTSRPQALGGTAVAAMNSTGGTGTQVQSCNAIGAGVNAGCLKSQIDAAHAERRRDQREGEAIP
ncbi:hypothetical protein [Sphingomonas sp.]|uniref:hypothetical protein n=1 Tax=Sphingomonas sp. TaxID=28214 RepID=UPI003B00F782